MIDNLKDFLTVIQLLVTCGTLISMLYVLKKFLSKPHDTLSENYNTLKKEFEEYKRSIDMKILDIERSATIKSQEFTRSLQLGNEGFKELRETTRVMQKCMLALIDFEISYCQNTHYDEKGMDNLEEAKITLRNYLGDK